MSILPENWIATRRRPIVLEILTAYEEEKNRLNDLRLEMVARLRKETVECPHDTVLIDEDLVQAVCLGCGLYQNEDEGEDVTLGQVDGSPNRLVIAAAVSLIEQYRLVDDWDGPVHL